jgi:Tol biopolymer transport system component
MKSIRHTPLSGTALAVLLMTVFGVGRTDAQERRTLTIDDMFAIQRVGDPQISPDGDWVTYTVSKTDFDKGRSETRIWMVSTDGGNAVPMTGTGSSASRPRWSPDGRYLSFLAARNEGKTQVWTLNRMGGEAVQLTNIARGVQSYDWSPDGSRLLLTLRDSTDEDEDDDEPKPWVIDRLQFKRDNVGYLVDSTRSHLYVYTIADESLRQITSGEFSASQPVWSPDGGRVAFTANRTENPDANENSDIWIVDARNTDKGASLRRVTSNQGSDNSPAWSPEGDRPSC